MAALLWHSSESSKTFTKPSTLKPMTTDQRQDFYTRMHDLVSSLSEQEIVGDENADYIAPAISKELAAASVTSDWQPPSNAEEADFWIVNGLGDVKHVAEVLPLFRDTRVLAIAELLAARDGYGQCKIPGAIINLEVLLPDGSNAWHSVDLETEEYGAPLMTKVGKPDGPEDAPCHLAWMDYHHRAGEIVKKLLEMP